LDRSATGARIHKAVRMQERKKVSKVLIQGTDLLDFGWLCAILGGEVISFFYTFTTMSLDSNDNNDTVESTMLP